MFRLLDIMISATILLLTMPVFIFLLILGWLENGSPLFFQSRVGKDRKLFTLVKFRTMTRGTASVGTHLVDSTAITKLGRFLRSTKLDELPQLFNVVAGHMSLVGPRPCLPNQLELIEQREKRGVFEYLPGITGLAQVNNVDMSTPRKLARYDQLMLKRLDLELYLRLILLTASGRGGGDRVKQAPLD